MWTCGHVVTFMPRWLYSQRKIIVYYLGSFITGLDMKVYVLLLSFDPSGVEPCAVFL
jgi:hypothetical protein